MPAYPPKLVQIERATCGSLLRLSDNRDVLIDVPPERLNQALLECRKIPLSDLVEGQSLEVFADDRKVTEEDWDKIRAYLLASTVARDVFRDIPSIWQSFREPMTFVRDLPHRVYVGLEHALYTSHPFQFQTDPNRSAQWRYGLLSASGGRLFMTWVHLNRGNVEIESDVRKCHFLE
jgi:hypothetical protein